VYRSTVATTLGEYGDETGLNFEGHMIVDTNLHAAHVFCIPNLANL